ncbi:MAG: 50S ribosomal protein L20 [Spirochaetota bacterium]|nr:50S ribosomal protein L20 [Spirochaetota bacterium]
MTRARSGLIHRKKRRKVLRDVKGFYGSRKNLYRTAKDARRRALQNSYIDRKRKKRDFRSLWIIRINAASRICGVSYNKLIAGMKAHDIKINRKMLAELAVSDLKAFQKIVDAAIEESA